MMSKAKFSISSLLFFVAISLAQQELKSNTAPDARNYFISFYARELSLFMGKKTGAENALRLNMNLAGTISGGTMKTGSSSSQKSDNNLHDLNLSLSLQYLEMLFQKGNFAFYFGNGPYLGYRRTKSKREPDPNASHDYAEENLSQSFAIGVTSAVGMEAALVSNFKLFAEYVLLGTFQWDKNERKIFTTNKSKNESWQFTFNGLKFGFSVYF